MDGRALRFCPRSGSAGQGKIRRAAFLPQHGQLAQRKAAEADACSFQKCLFGSKIRGGSLGTVRPAPRREQRLLLRREDVVDESRPRQTFFNAACVTQVDADAEDHTCST